MHLEVEIEGQAAVPRLPGGGANLVAFMSFAAVRGFGARHPLIALSERVAALGVRLGPLTTFYERTAEDAIDQANLERAWQAAAPLAASLAALGQALATDERAAALARRAEAGELAGEAAVVLAAIAPAAAAGGRVRLTYEL